MFNSKLPLTIFKIRKFIKQYEVTLMLSLRWSSLWKRKCELLTTQYFYRLVCEENGPMIQWKFTARKVSKAHLGHELNDSEIKNLACCWPLSSCPPLVWLHMQLVIYVIVWFLDALILTLHKHTLLLHNYEYRCKKLQTT